MSGGFFSPAGDVSGVGVRYYRQNWAFINLPIGIIAIIVALAAWSALDGPAAILLILFAVMTFHQFEEYAWPGGEQWIMNRVMQPKDLSVADRYPLNQQSAMVTNAFLALPVHLLAVVFALQGWYWLGITVAIAEFGQIVVHGILTNIKLKWFYNPGLFTAVFGFGGVGAWYLSYISVNNLVTGWDWLWGVIGVPIFMAGIIAIPTYRIMAHKDSPYPFSTAEQHRFNATWFLTRLGQTAP